MHDKTEVRDLSICGKLKEKQKERKLEKYLNRKRTDFEMKKKKKNNTR